MSIYTFPTTVIGPSFPVEISMEPRILKNQFGDGYTSEAPDGINFMLRSFSLTWDALTQDERDTIKTFLEARGGYQSFNWTYQSVSYLVKCRKWSFTQIEPATYRLTTIFEEVPI